MQKIKRSELNLILDRATINDLDELCDVIDHTGHFFGWGIITSDKYADWLIDKMRACWDGIDVDYMMTWLPSQQSPLEAYYWQHLCLLGRDEYIPIDEECLKSIKWEFVKYLEKEGMITEDVGDVVEEEMSLVYAEVMSEAKAEREALDEKLSLLF